MTRTRVRRAALLAGAGAAAAVAAYPFTLRRRLVRWGATRTEATEPLPGDDLVPEPRSQSTRAVTIEAPAEDVWPWLVQMGQGRAGLYSYDWLENLVGCDMHSEYRIVPELQHIEPGDRIRLVPPERADLELEVHSVVPGRALVLETPGDQVENVLVGLMSASWAFVVRPIDAGRCRLIVRWRCDFEPSLTGELSYKVGLEPVHFMMERKMLDGIKARAEQHARLRTLPLQHSA